MPTGRADQDSRLRQTLQHRISAARGQTDKLFSIVRPEALRDRPITERHRLIFYLGHLEAFDFNMICRTAFGCESLNPAFDRLFEFGIDPTDGNLPSDEAADWPRVDEILGYNQQVRQLVDTCLQRARFAESDLPFVEGGTIFQAAIEHRLMHAETLVYLLNQLPDDRRVRRPFEGVFDGAHPAPSVIGIPAGRATLGLLPKDGSQFGWDNEFNAVEVDVPAFAIDAYDVTNGQFLEFVRAGCYREESFWSKDDWIWVNRSGIRHPAFWVDRGEDWYYSTVFGEIPLPEQWPVYVSHAEASAYASWKGKSLPTEPQWHRAALGTFEGKERRYPWGDEPPNPSLGNFDFHSWYPIPVGSNPAGRSAFGVHELVGNGWEWTSTIFEPLPGFQPFAFYPGYSANFFDGRHYVMKGGSSRTAARLLRRSFRNWFQPHYPYVYATFRCVEV